MWKLLLALLFLTLQVQEGFCQVVQWNKTVPLSTDLKNIWPATSQANNSILDSLLSNYQRGLYLTYTSATTLTATPGEIVVSNSIGTVREFLIATTSTAITATNIDTGSIAANTTYYVYAGTSSTTASAPTFYISLSSTSPTGVTYYELIGQFTTDANTQFTSIVNYNWETGYVGVQVNKSVGVVYQCLTDMYLQALCGYTNGTCTIVSDSSSSPSTTISQCQSTSTSGAGTQCNVSGFCQKGNYYKFSSNIGAAAYAISMSK